MVILDGNKLSVEIIERLKKEAEGKNLTLAVVLVGKNIISKSYIFKKKEASEKIGIRFNLIELPVEISQNGLEDKVKELADDKNVSGIVIQLPLPKGIDLEKVLDLVPEEKDPDMLSKKSKDKLESGQSDILPPVVSGIKKLLEEYKIEITGKKIAVLGRGRLVGKPLALWLSSIKADFDVLDRNTKEISEIVRNADIIITDVGVPEIIKKDMIKEGAVLIDAGTSSEGGEIKGDVEKSAYKKASFVAPVPGGVGPMTVVCLLENLTKIQRRY